ncbi:MAG: DinB family protein [Chitinophagales bacterium]|nr:DinB family protein [Chitinophagales bacterium]
MNTNATVVKMLLDRWYGSVKNCDALLNAISNEQLDKEISPGKNRGIYLLGHLIAVHDHMLQLTGFGDLKYPELAPIFIEAPDKAVSEIPTADKLRAIWKEQNEDIKQKLEGLSADNWFEKHTAVTAEDFAKEPHRNKLNILLTRTTHLTYHTGQLVLFK